MREKYIENEDLPLTLLREMEVIDISEGKRLGFINDIILDDDLSRIESLIIPPQGNFISILKKKEEIKIHWNQIKVIGYDVILVDLKASKNANHEELDES